MSKSTMDTPAHLQSQLAGPARQAYAQEQVQFLLTNHMEGFSMGRLKAGTLGKCILPDSSHRILRPHLTSVEGFKLESLFCGCI